MMEELTITRQTHPGGGEYRAHPADSHIFGRMSWVDIEGGRLVDHTIVPPEIGGRGIAAKLVEAIVADARAEGFKVIPQCSYVVAAFRRHPEWVDIRG